MYIVYVSWHVPEAVGPFDSKEKAMKWLKNHCDIWIEDLEEFQCADHDLNMQEHDVVVLEEVK